MAGNSAISAIVGVPPTNQIENPDPMAGTNNWYKQDGYSGGSYVNCSSATAPGVGAINNYLTSLPYTTFWGRNCAPGYYYLVNNYNPGYLGDGTAAPLGTTTYTTPPTTQNKVSMPSRSISMVCARTMSGMVMIGKSSPHNLPVAGLVEAGPVEPRQPPITFEQITK